MLILAAFQRALVCLMHSANAHRELSPKRRRWALGFYRNCYWKHNYWMLSKKLG